jgi:hypothetical protein
MKVSPIPSKTYSKKEKDKLIDKLLLLMMKKLLPLKVLIKKVLKKMKIKPILMDILSKLPKTSLNYNITLEKLKKMLRKELIFQVFPPVKKLL